MNEQEIFVQTNEMDLEGVQDSLDENERNKRQEAFLIESVIGVNQNLPSEGSSTPMYSWSRRGSFTLEEDQPRNQTRKYSFEMIDSIFKESQPIKNPAAPLKEAMILEMVPQEPKMIQRARSHSLASIDGSSSENTFDRPHHSMADCIQVGKNGSELTEPQPIRTTKSSHLESATSKAGFDASACQAGSVTKSKNQLSEVSSETHLDPLLHEETGADRSDQLVGETIDSPLDCFDFEEQLSLANANIPEGKNGKNLSNFSVEKHLNFREKHDLQPDRVGACLQDHLCCLRI